MPIRIGGRTHRRESGMKIFNIFQALLGDIIGDGFTDKKNGYGLHHFATILTEMCNSSCTSEAAVKNLEHKKIPGGRWFRNMAHAISPLQLGLLAKTMLDETVKISHGASLPKTKDLLIAIDKHLIPRYDRGDITGLVRAAEKAGSTLHECYATMQVVSGPVPAILECLRVTPCLNNAELLRRFAAVLSEHGIREKFLLLDREFFAVDLMDILNSAGRRFLMPAVKHTGIKRAIDEFIAGTRPAVSEYTMRNWAGLSFKFTLVITRKKQKTRRARFRSKEEEKCTKSKGSSGKKNKREKSIYDDYMVFATNLPAEGLMEKIGDLVETYRGRWRIEIGYRQAESIRPWTTSKKAGYHFLLFLATMFMHNMWASERTSHDINKSELTLKSLIKRAIEHALKHIPDYVDPGGGYKGPGAPPYLENR